MSASTWVLLAALATASPERGTVDRGFLDGLTEGDEGKVFYELVISGVERRVEIGSALVIGVGPDAAELKLTTKRPAEPGFLVEFSIPSDRRLSLREVVRWIEEEPSATAAAALEDWLASERRSDSPVGKYLRERVARATEPDATDQMAAESPKPRGETRIADVEPEASQKPRIEIKRVDTDAPKTRPREAPSVSSRAARRLGPPAKEPAQDPSLAQVPEPVASEPAELKREPATRRGPPTPEVPRVAPPQPPAAAPTEPKVATSAQSPPTSEGEAKRQIRSLLFRWTRAWERGDADGYLGCYADDFVPQGAASKGSWTATRRAALEAQGDVDLTLESVEIDFRPSTRASVSFRQSYSSNGTKNRVRKVLELTWQDGGWRIVREWVRGR